MDNEFRRRCVAYAFQQPNSARLRYGCQQNPVWQIFPDMLFHKGFSLNFNASRSDFIINAGVSFLDNYVEEEGVRTTPVLTENWSGSWGITYPVPSWDLTFNYTEVFTVPCDCLFWEMPTQGRHILLCGVCKTSRLITVQVIPLHFSWG